MGSKQARGQVMRGMGLVLVMLVGLGGVLLSGAGSAQALTLVNPAGGCPKTLNTPGEEYILTGDLACSGVVNGVNITASGVIFHLAGHTISNDATCGALSNQASSGIFVQSGLSKVHIDGGTVSGFNDGILLSSSFSRVRGMTVTDTCVFGILVQGDKNQVDTNVVTASKIDGIALVPASNAVITSNDTSGNVRAGISLSDFAANNTITNNITHGSLKLRGGFEKCKLKRR